MVEAVEVVEAVGGGGALVTQKLHRLTADSNASLGRSRTSAAPPGHVRMSALTVSSATVSRHCTYVESKEARPSASWLSGGCFQRRQIMPRVERESAARFTLASHTGLVFDIALHGEQAGHERPEASRRPMQREEEGVEVVHGRTPPGSEVPDELELLQPALRTSTRALRTSTRALRTSGTVRLGRRLHARSLRRPGNSVSSVLPLEGEAGEVHLARYL